ncbi:MAG: hypothetical protein K0B06_12895 [Brevefilum sp.]|nr:hypothetical protein [Brevefilum sp.]
MNAIKDEIFLKGVETPAEGLALLGQLTEAASPQAVYGQPLQQGDHTVIPANAVSVGLGLGLVGFVLGRKESGQEEHQQARQEVNGGGGGGGSSRARPVAVISIGPEGVEVKPVIDVTQICLAFFSAFAAIFIASKKIKKMAK